MALTWLALLLASPPADFLAPDSDLDALAPYLGLTPLDAEDLAADIAEDAMEPQRSEPPRRSALLAGQGRWWTALLPRLTLAFGRREAVQLTGADRFGQRSSTLFLLELSFAGEVAAAPALPLQPVVARELVESRAAEAAAPGEPTIAEVQAAAERAALVHLADLGDWRSRARASAWLPELTLDYRRNVGEIDTLGIRSDLGIDSHNLQDITRYGARASWTLGQLVFAGAEVSAAQAAMELQRLRQDEIARVTELYFERQRLLARLAPEYAREPGRAELRLEEVTALLDGLTGGFVSQRLRALAGPAEGRR